MGSRRLKGLAPLVALRCSASEKDNLISGVVDVYEADFQKIGLCGFIGIKNYSQYYNKM
jgi:hypothetical protein